MPQISVGNGYYVSTSTTISNQLCTNWYPNYPQSNALSPQSLIPTPGIEFLNSTSTIINRGGIVFDGDPYVINGGTLYRIDETVVDSVRSYSSEALGTIVGTGRVSISKNNTQICILVPGVRGYIYTVAGGLEEITFPATVELGFPNVVVYLGGFFVFATDTNLFTSALNDGLTYDPLDFASAEVDPDNIVTLHVYKNQLYVLGGDTTEIFENVGNPEGFPLQRVEGFIIDKGCSGIFAVVDFQDSFVFLGSGKNEQPAIWMMQGNDTQKISTTSIDNSVDDLTMAELENTVALSYAQDGAYFAIFTFPDNTFVYDFTASTMSERPIWHKRESIINQTTLTWRVGVVLEAFGRLIVADRVNGDFGALELSFNEEYGLHVLREWSSSFLVKDPIAPLFLKTIEVTVESGVGEDEDALLGLSISDDGGRTYSKDIPRTIGDTGNYQTLLIWNRLGRYERFATIRLRYSSNSRCVIARIDATIA